MAHIYADDYVTKMQGAVSPLHDADLNTQVAVYKAAQAGDPDARESWAAYEYESPELARLVPAYIENVRQGYGDGEPVGKVATASVVPVLSDEWFDGLEKAAAADPTGMAALADPAGWRRERVERAEKAAWSARMHALVKSGNPGEREFAHGELQKLLDGGAVDGQAGGAGASESEFAAYVQRAAAAGDPHARQLCAEHGWGW